MAIVKMNKFTLLAFECKKAELLEAMQAFSNVEFINLQDEKLLKDNEVLKDLTKDQVDSDITKWEGHLSKAKFAMQFLEKYVPKKSLIKSLRQEKISLTISELESKVLGNNWEEIYEKLVEKDDELGRLENEETRLKRSVKRLKPYETFDASLGLLKDLDKTSYFLGNIENKYEETLKSDFNDYYLEILSKDNENTYFFALTNKDNVKVAGEVLRIYGFIPLKFDEEETPLKLIQNYNERISILEANKFLLKEELAVYEDELKIVHLAYEYYNNLVSRKIISSNFLKTKSMTLIQGWIPIDQNEKFTKIVKEVLGDDYYLNFEEVKEEEIDEVPILLKNNDLNSAFESVTGMYSLPKYNYIDPTPLITPFYLIFFGMMVADAGYGLFMLIGTLLALKFFHFDNEKNKLVKFFMYLSFPTITFGLMYGSFFGDIIKFNRYIDINKDVMTIFILSIVFGVIQIFVGLGIKAFVLIKMGKPLEAFMDVGTLAITLASLLGIGASVMLSIPTLKTICIATAIMGALLIVFSKGRHVKSKGGKIGQALYELYGITSYLGDFVSYTRLMAIGLSGGIIAGAINMIIKMIPGPIGVFIIGPLLFVIFQTVNLLLSLLNGYVHTLRLTYVEYFSKFYDGGGRPFKPFETNSTYINLKRE